MKRLALFALLLTVSCTDARCSRFTTAVTGNAARIVCHSGGRVIYDGCSTGKVSSEEGSDGYFFRDRETGRLVEVSGECLLDYDAPCPTKTVRPAAP